MNDDWQIDKSSQHYI